MRLKFVLWILHNSCYSAISIVDVQLIDFLLNKWLHPVEIKNLEVVGVGFMEEVVSYLGHYRALARMLVIVNFLMLLSALHDL